jgi:hypothetical protein
MGYVIAAVLVLLIVAAGVTFFVLNATRRQRQDSIVAPDEETPLGDTDQHHGEQTTTGRTVAGQEGERGEPARGSVPPAGEGGVGGEGEGGGTVGPESERLANRPR